MLLKGFIFVASFRRRGPSVVLCNRLYTRRIYPLITPVPRIILEQQSQPTEQKRHPNTRPTIVDDSARNRTEHTLRCRERKSCRLHLYELRTRKHLWNNLPQYNGKLLQFRRGTSNTSRLGRQLLFLLGKRAVMRN